MSIIFFDKYKQLPSSYNIFNSSTPNKMELQEKRIYAYV